MSSVNSSSSRSSNDEQIRKLREEYKRREAELIKKHNQEINKLSKTNLEQTDSIKDNANDRIGRVKNETREAVTKRDAQYRKEIADMKKFHTKQLERVMRNNETKLKQERSALKAENEQLKSGKNDRVSELNSKYTKTINSKSQDYQQLMDTMRERQQDSFSELKGDLQKRHEEERESLRKTYQEQIVKLQNDLRTTRYSSNEKLRGQEIRHMNDKTKMENFLMSEVQGREVSHAEAQDELRDQYAKGLDNVRQESLDQQRERSFNSQVNHDQFKQDVNDRLTQRENRLEQKLAHEQKRNVRVEDTIAKEAKQEINAWRDQYEEKYKALENEKRMIKDAAKESNKDDLQLVHKQASTAIANNNRYMQNVMDTNYLKSRQAIDALENEIDLKTDQLQGNASTRIDNIREDALNTEERLKTNFAENLEITKRQHEQELRDMRLELIKDKNDKIQQVKNQARQQEVENEKKLAATVQKYEKRIGELNDKFNREKKLRDNREKQLVDSMNRAREAEKEALVLKYTEKNQQVNEKHRDEVETISRRHQEQVANIMSSSKKV